MSQRHKAVSLTWLTPTVQIQKYKLTGLGTECRIPSVIQSRIWKQTLFSTRALPATSWKTQSTQTFLSLISSSIRWILNRPFFIGPHKQDILVKEITVSEDFLENAEYHKL